MIRRFEYGLPPPRKAALSSGWQAPPGNRSFLGRYVTIGKVPAGAVLRSDARPVCSL